MNHVCGGGTRGALSFSCVLVRVCARGFFCLLFPSLCVFVSFCWHPSTPPPRLPAMATRRGTAPATSRTKCVGGHHQADEEKKASIHDEKLFFFGGGAIPRKCASPLFAHSASSCRAPSRLNSTHTHTRQIQAKREPPSLSRVEEGERTRVCVRARLWKPILPCRRRQTSLLPLTGNAMITYAELLTTTNHPSSEYAFFFLLLSAPPPRNERGRIHALAPLLLSDSSLSRSWHAPPAQVSAAVPVTRWKLLSEWTVTECVSGCVCRSCDWCFPPPSNCQAL